MLTAQQLNDNWLNSKVLTHSVTMYSERTRNDNSRLPYSAGPFILTRPPGDRGMRSTQQQEDAWSDGLGGGVHQVKGGHLKPHGRGTSRTGRTLWTHWERYGGHLEHMQYLKVDFNYFRFRKSQDYTRFETETISGTLPQTKLHSVTSISRNTVFVC